MKRMKMSYKNDKTFKDGFNEFILNCKARNLREATIRHYEVSNKQIIKYLDENMKISDISKNTFDEFVINVKKYSNANSHLLQGFKNHCTFLYG